MAYQSNHSGQTIDNAVNTVNNFDMSQLRDFFYSIGSIYTSTKSTSPATLFGGTWVQIKDTFLLTAGDTYSAGSSGGAATHTHTSAAHTHTTAGHTLTTSEMPKHTHASYGQIPRINDSSVSGTTYGHSSSEASWWFRSVAGEVQSAGGGASHSHGNTGSTTPGATGSSSSLPPYRVVYAWERTA